MASGKLLFRLGLGSASSSSCNEGGIPRAPYTCAEPSVDRCPLRCPFPQDRGSSKRRVGCRCSESSSHSLEQAPVRKGSDKRGPFPGSLLSPDEKLLDRPSSLATGPLKLILGGAAAVVTVALCVNLGAHLVESLESVPPLAHLELLIGLGVTAKGLTLYLADPAARSRLDEKLARAVEVVRAALGLSLGEGETTEEVNDKPARRGEQAQHILPGDVMEGLSMLEVELRSIVDASADVAMGLDGPPPSSITIDRKALVESVAEYIRSREVQAKASQEILLEQMETAEVIRSGLVSLQKSRDARRSRLAQELASWEKLQICTDDRVESEEKGSNGLISESWPAAPVADAILKDSDITTPKTSGDEIAEATEKARRFRDRLDAMKRSRDRRQQESNTM